MTLDEMESRITRLETRQAAHAALLHAVLPAIDPARRQLVLEQFRQYCSSTEAAIFADDVPQPLADWHLELLAGEYRALEGTLKLIEAHEAKEK